ncbi:MAG: ATP-binding protein [Flavobacteriaceae bacterium]|nr:ATP-binding protein [Flavobacteriaceae bacterium]
MNSKKNIVSDRGRAHYFHGRNSEIDAFQKILKLSKADGKGHSMLIQGAPGVGKTALLRELEKKGEQAGWTVSKIELDALWNVNELHNALMDDEEYEKKTKEYQVNIKVANASMRYDKREQTFSKTIRAIKKPHILVLDEAQMIGVGQAKDSPEMKQASYVMSQLHNVELKQGLVFLIAGLSDTRKIFKDFKISRFNDDCVIHLNLLEKEAEKSILKDYLVKGAGVDRQHPDLHHWMDRMVKETHRWAHHISCYGQVASKMVKSNGGYLSNDLLSEVLKESRRKKKELLQGSFY